MFEPDDSVELEFLDPGEAKKRLQREYEDAGTNRVFLKREVKDLRKRCHDEPFFFLLTCFPHRFGNPQNQQARRYVFCDAHHALWDATNLLHKLVVMACFRGLGKSTIAGFGKTIWDICERTSDFIVMGSYNERMVRKLIFPIMLELEANPRLQQLYGNLTGTRIWNSQNILTANAVKLEGLGIGQTIRGALTSDGARPQVLVLDDIINNEAAHSPVQKEALLRWLFSDLLPAMRPEGWSARLLATMVSAQSAIYDLCYDEQYKEKVELLLINIRDKEGKPTWEHRFPEKVIERYKNTLPAYAWKGEYMMPPEPDEGVMFNRKEHVQYYAEDELRGKTLFTIAFNDPAARTGAKNDFTAMPVISLDQQTGIMYVRRGSMYRRAADDEIVQQVYYIDELYPQLTVIFEGNGFQRLFKYIFSLWFKLRGYSPKVQTIDRKGNKQMRMSGLYPYFNNGTLRFLKDDPDQERGITDMVTPRAHDDWPDALIGGCDFIETVLRNVGLAATPTEGEKFERHYKSVQDVLQSTAKGWANETSLTAQKIHDLMQPQAQVEVWESRLERYVKKCLERSKTIQCGRDEYSLVRTYLMKWAIEYQDQPTKAEYAKAEQERLDQRFQRK